MKGAVAVSADDDKWRIEGDARTLKEAEIIKADKPRLKKALAYVSKEKVALNAINFDGLG